MSFLKHILRGLSLVPAKQEEISSPPQIDKPAEEASQKYTPSTIETTDYHPAMWKGMGAVDDVVAGLQFCATMQLRTPLRVLSRDGEMHYASGPPPTIATELWMGIWVLKTKTWREMEIDMDEAPLGTRASDIGQIPSDGGDYLKFLFAIRHIVERNESIKERIKALKHELSKPEWKDFCHKLKGKEHICSLFFPEFIRTIPGIPHFAIWDLFDRGLTTPQKIMDTPDKELLAIKGIGKAKLKAIRAACESAADKESELVDRVER